MSEEYSLLNQNMQVLYLQKQWLLQIHNIPFPKSPEYFLIPLQYRICPFSELKDMPV
jgi:hypothetical protein